MKQLLMMKYAPLTIHCSIIRRDQNRRGGGVAILLSDRVHYLPCSDINTGNIESVWIELFPNSCH